MDITTLMQYFAEQSITRDKQFAAFIQATARSDSPSNPHLAGKAFSTLSKLQNPEDLDMHFFNFESLAKLHHVPSEHWVTYFSPLLDSASQRHLQSMSAEDKADFSQVKRALLALHGHH